MVSRALLERPLFELIPLRDALERAESLPPGAGATRFAQGGPEVRVRLLRITAGAPVAPLLILFALNLVDELGTLDDAVGQGDVFDPGTIDPLVTFRDALEQVLLDEAWADGVEVR